MLEHAERCCHDGDHSEDEEEASGHGSPAVGAEEEEPKIELPKVASLQAAPGVVGAAARGVADLHGGEREFPPAHHRGVVADSLPHRPHAAHPPTRRPPPGSSIVPLEHQ